MRSSFAKYLTAFVVIITVSFLALSSIITSIIRNYVTNDTEEKLEFATDMIVDYIDGQRFEELESYIATQQLSVFLVPIVDFDTKFEVIVCDESGKILLSTAYGSNGDYESYTSRDMGKINVEKQLSKITEDDGTYSYSHEGTLGGILKSKSTVCAKEIICGGDVCGYVMTVANTTTEDKLVSISRRAVLNSSVWVLLAAVIAVYFITERIIHPMRSMTVAAKKFAKGDFSARVTVYGKDEVSDLANAFNNMAESIDSLEKMRNSFLANVSHDLRTPMTTIAGFIDGITSGAIPPEKHEYYLGIISAEVHRLSRLVNQILDVSRLESGERKFNYTDFNVAEVARLILISFEQKIEDKKLEVSFESDSDDMIVNADKDAIYQVLYNLCHNAIKFSREGGRFEIRITKTQSRKVQITVFDEGQGISPEDAKFVFERFYKTDESRGLDKHGVGLGLYICKTIIDAHDEKIWVESETEDSTAFVFTLKEGFTLPKRKYQDTEEQ